jgi:DNA repair protein RadD
MELRYYQREAIDATYKYLNEHAGRNPCIVLPTAAGKTHVIKQICNDICKWGGLVLVLAHVKELLEQAADKLSDTDIDVGVYSAGLKSRDTCHDVIVAGIQSVYKRAVELSQCGFFNVILVDEAHRIPTESDGMYTHLLRELGEINPKVRVVGLTATPFRTKGGYVCTDDHFLNDVCYEVSVAELIAGGFLSKIVSKNAVAHINTSGLKITRGEFDEAQMSERFDEKVESATREIIEYTGDRKKTLIFCCNINHADQVCELIRGHGLSAGVVSSKHDFRDETIKDFKEGRIQYLVNVNVLCEGFDAPDIDCVALMRSTVSPGLYYQMVGRGLRIHPNKKDCLILDFGENVKRHGTLDNLNIKEGGRTSGDGEAPVKECPSCHELVATGLLYCTACGHKFPPRELNHEHTASDDNPVIVEVRTLEVSEENAKVWVKKSNGSRTMRVEYRCGISEWVSEWICIEHEGFAREKAEGWWASRFDTDCPNCVDEAVELFYADRLMSTKEITVVKDGRYDRIVDYKLEVREEEEGEVDRLHDEDGIPF